MMISALYQLVELFVVLYHWNNKLQLHNHVAPSGEHIILIPNESIFGLTSYFCVHSEETTNSNFIIFGFVRPRIDLAIYRTLKGQANDYTTEVVSKRRHADNNCLTKQGDKTMYIVQTMNLRIFMVKRGNVRTDESLIFIGGIWHKTADQLRITQIVLKDMDKVLFYTHKTSCAFNTSPIEAPMRYTNVGYTPLRTSTYFYI